MTTPFPIAGIVALGATSAAAVATTVVLGTDSSPEATVAVSFEHTGTDGALQQCDGAIWVLPSTTVQTVQGPNGEWQHVLPEVGGVTYVQGSDEEFSGSAMTQDTLLGGDRLPVEPLAYDQAEFDAVRDLVVALPSDELLADDMATLDVEDDAWTDNITEAVVAAGYGDTESVRLVIAVGCVAP